jgi:DNA modification methylase
VLDPFAGTATVARVALEHGRGAIGFDLSGEYLREMATKRTHNVQIDLLSATGAR